MPLAKVWLSALSAYGILVAWVGPSIGNRASFFVWLAAGLLYAHLFEYGYHRVVMHAGVRFLAFAKRSHLEHHRAFHSEHFTSRRPEERAQIPSLWFVFPTLFVVHYVPVSLVLPGPIRLAFFTGVTFHYLVFETTHWFTHIEGNRFDRVLSRLPLLGALRRFQVRHHRVHHEIPDADFNFNPPFLGDLIFRTWRTPPREFAE